MGDLLHDSIAFLKKSGANGKNLYDHLSDVIVKILEQKPDNAYNAFENISTTVKKGELKTDLSTTGASGTVISDQPVVPTTKEFAKRLALFTVADEEEQEDAPEVEPANMLEEATALEWAGVGLTKEDTYRLMLATRTLMKNHPLKSVRFFGKIFGLNNDYYVVESEYKDGEVEEDLDTVHMAIPPIKEKAPRGDEDSESDEPKEAKETAKPTAQQAPVIPAEDFTGTNKHTYWVCVGIGEDWVRLPRVTPAQIVAARSITKYFTGNLDASIKSHPPFPGVEKNYLRAQIARIAAGTIISPKGYFLNEGEEEDEAEDEEETILVPDPEFAGHPASALLELSNWVHHQQHILPQGRCTYFRVPKQRKEEDEEEEEEEEEEQEDEEETPPETGPRVLTEVSEDSAVGQIPAWAVRTGTQYNKKNPVVYVRSTAWPGAVCVSWGSSVCQKFANIYVGYGKKYTEDPFTPMLPPMPQKEGVDMIEATDPSAEDEKELERQREAERKQNEPEAGAEGEGEDEEGEEGEGEEEDDGDYED